MTHTIYKYKLTANGANIELPIDSELLCMQAIDDEPYLWFKINKEEDKTEMRNFEVFGTGWPIETDKSDFEYINSFQQMNGALVWHVFERFPKITSETVREVREALDLSMNEAKSLLEEHKGNVKSVFSKFGISCTFKEFQKTREKDNIPFDILGREEPQEGYLYLDKQCAIILLPNFEYELILGNMDYVSTNLEELEMKLYKWAMSEGF